MPSPASVASPPDPLVLQADQAGRGPQLHHGATRGAVRAVPPAPAAHRLQHPHRRQHPREPHRAGGAAGQDAGTQHTLQGSRLCWHSTPSLRLCWELGPIAHVVMLLRAHRDPHSLAQHSACPLRRWWTCQATRSSRWCPCSHSRRRRPRSCAPATAASASCQSQTACPLRWCPWTSGGAHLPAACALPGVLQ